MEIFDFLASNGVRIDPSNDDVTLLMQAVAKKRPEFVAYLLDNANKCDLDVNARDLDGWDACFYACASSQVNVFKMLCDGGVKTRTAKDGSTVLMHAASQGTLFMICKLTENVVCKNFSMEYRLNVCPLQEIQIWLSICLIILKS